MPDDASIEVMLGELDNHPTLTSWECDFTESVAISMPTAER